MEIVRCAFCQQLEHLSKEYDYDREGYNMAITNLFDQADRARLLRQAYGRRHGR